MGVTNPVGARDRLSLQAKQLNLVLAIDHIRDTIPKPPAMLAAIARVLTEQLPADVCTLYLVDQETGELKQKAVNDRSGQSRYLSPALARNLVEQAIKTGGVVLVQEDGLSPAQSFTPPHQDYRGTAFLSIDQDQAGDVGPRHTLQVAAIGVVLSDEQSSGAHLSLGAILVARFQPPFDQDDIALLKTAESQIDSALNQASAYHELRARKLELETIYRVDRIRDRNLPFDEMLNKVLEQLCAVIHAEMGFIMLYDRAGRRLELRAATHDDLSRLTPSYTSVEQAANQALHHAQLVCYNDLGATLHSVMCVPLILHDEIIGVLGVANRYGPQGFDGEDRRMLMGIASQMDTAIFESLERVRLRQVLGRSVDPRVMERLLANPDVAFLKGERSVLSVLYADIRGSTSLAERTDPELLVGFINDYLSRMTQVILSHHGTLDKFVGDEVMALFGAPFPQDDHALRAVRVGLEMQKAHQAVMENWWAQGVEAAPIGIGIATGELIVGEMGSAQRSDYTVIGRAANLGARICSAAKAGQVLISQATFDLVKGRVEAVPISGLDLKGVSNNVTVYHVTRALA